VTESYAAALAAFRREAAGGWAVLPFFQGDAADGIARRLDQRVLAGHPVLPPSADVFTALRLTPPAQVRAVILGQDPYPTPGDAHGLAFSVRSGVAVPRSLRNIFRELEDDLGVPRPVDGSLLSWAGQGVLLLNACLTVEAGQAGVHRGLGWERLADEVVRHVSITSNGTVFVLWGADAQKRRHLIDEGKHLVIATAHPSPLSARRGFFGSRPFSRANAWIAARGQAPIGWKLS
jgi:uracil-DNA glycosylase